VRVVNPMVDREDSKVMIASRIEAWDKFNGRRRST
jgi:hypothetical protein